MTEVTVFSDFCEVDHYCELTRFGNLEVYGCGDGSRWARVGPRFFIVTNYKGCATSQLIVVLSMSVPKVGSMLTHFLNTLDVLL